MGQIVIETPLDISRIYQIDNKEFAAEMVASLEKSAQQLVNPPPELLEYLDDIQGILAARKALVEEGVISFEEAKKTLGL